MSSRFQPRGGVQTTFAAGTGPISPSASDITLSAQQQANYDACNALVSGVAFFLPNGNPDAKKNDTVQTQLQGINVPFTVASVQAFGATVSGWLGQTDWTATLVQRKAALATF